MKILKQLTVKDLKNFLNKVPDDTQVCVDVAHANTDGFDIIGIEYCKRHLTLIIDK
jgi:hypothetical protein